MEPRQWSKHLKAGPEKYQWYVNTEKLEEHERELRERWAKKERTTIFDIPDAHKTFADEVQPHLERYRDAMSRATLSLDMTADTFEMQKVFDELTRKAKSGRSGPKPLAELPWGHHESCPYRGSHHFPCTCQPPSLFGEEQRWYCDCCGEPRAMIQYGLCEMCEAHQYSDGRQADLEHDAAREDA